jgi:putative phage-type endonuclease
MSLIFNYNKDLPKVTNPRAQYLREQVIRLKNIFQPEQKTKEWYEMRETLLTASDWGTVLGENHYSNSNSVLLKKCGEDNFVTNEAMKWGNKYEDVAILIYEHRNNNKVIDFGCLKHPFISFLGASPDGITTDGVMVEIKCPTSRKITGIPPPYYWCQVQGQLEVCELDRCDFLECFLKEYNTESEYINDNYNNDFTLNKFGHEKGVVVEFYKKSSKTFFYKYSKVALLGNELELWKNDIVNEVCANDNSNDIMHSCFSYWYLEEVSCIPIYRNQEWFHKAKVELEKFWNNVLKYRVLGLAKLKEDLAREKEDAKIERKLKSTLKKEETAKKDTKKTKRDSSDVIILDFIDPDHNSITKENKIKKESNKKGLNRKESIRKVDSFDEIDNITFNTNTSLFYDPNELKTTENNSDDYNSDEDSVYGNTNISFF